MVGLDLLISCFFPYFGQVRDKWEFLKSLSKFGVMISASISSINMQHNFTLK